MPETRDEEEEMYQAVYKWLVSDVATMVVQYAAEERYNFDPIAKQPTLFMPRFTVDLEFAQYYQRATGKDLIYLKGQEIRINHPLEELGEDFTLQKIQEAEAAYRRAICRMPDKEEFPKSLFSLAWEQYFYKRSFSFMGWLFFKFEDRPEEAERLYEIVEYMLKLDRRFANMCYLKLRCCQYGFESPLNLAQERTDGQRLVDLLIQHGAEVPGEVLDPGPCTTF